MCIRDRRERERETERRLERKREGVRERKGERDEFKEFGSKKILLVGGA